jgi:hypothetical protein
MPSAKPLLLFSLKARVRLAFSSACRGRRQARLAKPSRNLFRQTVSPSLAGSQPPSSVGIWPTAWVASFSAALENLSTSRSEAERAVVSLAKPRAGRPSSGRSMAMLAMPPIRSLMVLAYSIRVKSRIGEGPGSTVWHRLSGGGGSLSVRGRPVLPPPGVVVEPPPVFVPPGLVPEPPVLLSPLIDPVHDAANSVTTRTDRAHRWEGAGLGMSYSS